MGGQKACSAIVDGRCRIGGEVQRDSDKVTLLLGDGFKRPLPPGLIDPPPSPRAWTSPGSTSPPSLAPPLSHYWADPEVALEVSRYANDGLAEVAEAAGACRWPTCPSRTWRWPSRRPAGSPRTSFRGIAVGSNAARTNLGDESLPPFWEAVRARDLFVFVHGLSPLGKERLGAASALELRRPARACSAAGRYLVERVGAGQVLLGSDHPPTSASPTRSPRSGPMSACWRRWAPSTTSARASPISPHRCW